MIRVPGTGRRVQETGDTGTWDRQGVEETGDTGTWDRQGYYRD